MRPLLRAAIRLYPRQWRTRYGFEFQALLDDLQPSCSTVLDVFRGGLRMRLTRSAFGAPAIVCGGIGLVVATTLAFFLEPRFASTALMRVTFADSSTVDSQLAHFLKARLINTQVPPHRVNVDRITGSAIRFQFSVLDADPRNGQKLAEGLVNQLVRTEGSVAAVEVIEMPNLPTMPVGPNRVAFAGTGLIGGGLLGMVLAVLRLRRSSTSGR